MNQAKQKQPAQNSEQLAIAAAILGRSGGLNLWRGLSKEELRLKMSEMGKLGLGVPRPRAKRMEAAQEKNFP